MMKPEAGVEVVSGILRFYTLEDMRRYIKGLLDTYQREYDRSSNVIGGMLRDKSRSGQEVIQSKGWTRVGEVVVNSVDPGRGSMEIIFQLLNEMKPRIKLTEDMLKSFDLVENLSIPEDATFVLFLRLGVPERIIIDSTVRRPERFAYTAKFQTV